MQIEWASSFRRDGSRRRPPPSTMHGWLAKMRGTLVGNEELRSKGMREMRDAKTLARRRAERNRHRASTGRSNGILSVFTDRLLRRTNVEATGPVNSRDVLSRPTHQSHLRSRTLPSARRPANSRDVLSRPTYHTRQGRQGYQRSYRTKSTRSSTKPSALSRRSAERTNREPSSQTYGPTGSQSLTPSTDHAASDSQESILMTPSSLAYSVMLRIGFGSQLFQFSR